MAKRTLSLNAERLTELTPAELSEVVGAAATVLGVCGPTVPDVNTCRSIPNCR
jgi:hypothetical protein